MVKDPKPRKAQNLSLSRACPSKVSWVMEDNSNCPGHQCFSKTAIVSMETTVPSPTQSQPPLLYLPLHPGGTEPLAAPNSLWLYYGYCETFPSPSIRVAPTSIASSFLRLEMRSVSCNWNVLSSDPHSRDLCLWDHLPLYECF